MRGSFCEVEKWLDSKSVPAGTGDLIDIHSDINGELGHASHISRIKKSGIVT